MLDLIIVTILVIGIVANARRLWKIARKHIPNR